MGSQNQDMTEATEHALSDVTTLKSERAIHEQGENYIHIHIYVYYIYVLYNFKTIFKCAKDMNSNITKENI